MTSELRCRKCKVRAARTKKVLCLQCEFPADNPVPAKPIECFKCGGDVEQGMGDLLKGICDTCWDKMMEVA